ncbi:ArsR/SmtB family transcription factor [Streptosporangium sp. NBC_01469]|uniref:ArsR/SmtB family transcription factor n=1 Tax=Streptosporangium sp. NBC_01469 TaxID=2903898 RepID=UPI002E2CF584|nr:helix-turn-helix domain-containing protein [Streptosporangium sp. NBC_01469]
MFEVGVIEEAGAAEAALDPIRARLLALLVEPHSATSLAAIIGLPRQKVNYHLKILQAHGLVKLIEERRRGNVTERVLRAVAASFVISPSALSALQPDPARSPDRLSVRWLLAIAARLVTEVGALLGGAARVGRSATTFALDGSVRFASATDRAAFTRELTATITALASRYHDEHTPGGRDHRVIIAIHPSLRSDTAPQIDAGGNDTKES